MKKSQAISLTAVAGLLGYIFTRPGKKKDLKGLNGTPTTSIVTKKNGIITHSQIRGMWDNTGNSNADINQSAGTIRIYGLHNDKHFDKTFRIGDEAEYDSWNLSYTAPIVAIGIKTITFKEAGNGYQKRRLDLSQFIWRNWNFNLAKIRKENSEYYD